MDYNSPGQKTHKSAARLSVTILLVCVLLLGAGGISFVWLAIQPKYLVSGFIHIAPTASDLWDSDPKPYDHDAYAAFMRTQAAMLGSTSVLSKVADELAGQGLAFFSPARMPAPAEGKLPAPSDILAKAIADGAIKTAPFLNTEFLEITMVSGKEDEAKIIIDSLRRNYQAIWGVQEAEAANQNLRMLEDKCQELSRRILQGRTEINSITRPYGTTQLDRRMEMESRRQSLLSEELVRLEQRRMSLEASVKSSVDDEAVTGDPVDLLSRRRDSIDSDPLVQALAGHIADIQVNLAAAREKEPNDVATIQRQQKVLDNLDQQFAQLRQARQQEFDQELSDAAGKQRQQRLANAEMELRQVKVYEERLREALMQEEAPQVGRLVGPDVQDIQLQLKLNEEFYEKACRSLHEIEMGRNQRPRVQLVSEPEVMGLVDSRWQWTLIVLGAAGLPSVILLIVRRAIRP
jgi:hypothetical protein